MLEFLLVRVCSDCSRAILLDPLELGCFLPLSNYFSAIWRLSGEGLKYCDWCCLGGSTEYSWNDF